MNLMIIHHLASRTNARADQIAKYLSESGHKVHLILWDVPYPAKLFFKNFFNSLKYKKYKRGKVIIHKIKRLPFFCPFFNKWLFHKQIRRIFKKCKIDVIISGSYINEMEPPSELPFIYDFVDDFETFAKFYCSKVYQYAFKILGVHKTILNQLKKGKAVITVSSLLTEYVNKYRKKNVYTLSNGVESWVLKNKFKSKKYNFGKYSLVYVSGFDYWSNLPSLLYSINELKKDMPEIKLILVGDGYQIPEGKKLVEQLNLKENVIFFGQINDRKKLFEIINSCDVCLNLSEKNYRQDTASPIKIFEYSALGKPIVSTKLKEVELLNFPNIIFYNDKNNNLDLIRAIKESFNKKVNKNKIKELVNKYTWENIAKEFERIIITDHEFHKK